MIKKGSPFAKAGSPVFLKSMKLIEQHIQKTFHRMQNQPLLLLLIAMFFISGTAKHIKRRLPAWAVRSL